MSSTHFDRSSGRWRVSWFRNDGTRPKRLFRTEAEALAFAASITDERPARQPGPTAIPETPENLRARIASGAAVNEAGCWIWQRRIGTHGYGALTGRDNGKPVVRLAHRVSYEAHVGPIPDGLQIDHLCAVTACVNPAHLEPVTAAENIRRRDERAQVSA